VGRVLVIRDQYMVMPEELGSQMMGSFLRKLCQAESRPDAILFYGTGVRLLAEGSTVLDAMEILWKAGVDLIACGTCVGYFELRDKMKIGRTTDMKEVIDTFMNTENVVTI
jgi:intracellular sulfur oxidation DsrE/DsrF family protein